MELPLFLFIAFIPNLFTRVEFRYFILKGKTIILLKGFIKRTLSMVHVKVVTDESMLFEDF